MYRDSMHQNFIVGGYCSSFGAALVLQVSFCNSWGCHIARVKFGEVVMGRYLADTRILQCNLYQDIHSQAMLDNTIENPQARLLTIGRWFVQKFGAHIFETLHQISMQNWFLQSHQFKLLIKRVHVLTERQLAVSMWLMIKGVYFVLFGVDNCLLNDGNA